MKETSEKSEKGLTIAITFKSSSRECKFSRCSKICIPYSFFEGVFNIDKEREKKYFELMGKFADELYEQIKNENG